MPTRAADDPGVGTAAKQVAERARKLVKVGLERARLEIKSKAGVVGLGLGAALVALFGLGFLVATIAVALAIVLDPWLALLIVTVALFAIAALLASLAKTKLSSDSGAAKQELDAAVEDLRDGLGEVTGVAGKLRPELPVVAVGALGAGFFLAGGIGATMRLLARKGRER